MTTTEGRRIQEIWLLGGLSILVWALEVFNSTRLRPGMGRRGLLSGLRGLLLSPLDKPRMITEHLKIGRAHV